MLKLSWWKWLCIVLIFYTLIEGFLGPVPALPILNETIRNLYFHVTMWFAMMILMTVSLVYSIKYLSKPLAHNDTVAEMSAKVGMLFGIIGILTGMIWAKNTWGAYWVNDAKLNGAAAALLVYTAYFILRNAIEDETKRARISSVYAIFAFTLMMVFIMVLPRMTDSLHPGNGGNPGFSTYDLDANMRKVFYPAVLGFTLLGIWIMQLKINIKKLQHFNDEQ
ncbi:MAG: cytochrome c biogenesis protein CcsA [Bacteroidetes bacterium]|nr:cytochrome c biogenesis protein CcsA [Bacteroidota bacterium]